MATLLAKHYRTVLGSQRLATLQTTSQRCKCSGMVSLLLYIQRSHIQNWNGDKLFSLMSFMHFLRSSKQTPDGASSPATPASSHIPSNLLSTNNRINLFYKKCCIQNWINQKQIQTNKWSSTYDNTTNWYSNAIVVTFFNDTFNYLKQILWLLLPLVM